MNKTVYDSRGRGEWGDEGLCRKDFKNKPGIWEKVSNEDNDAEFIFNYNLKVSIEGVEMWIY